MTIDKIDKTDAVLSLRPNAGFALNGEELTWMDEVQTQPTEDEIQAEIVRLQTEYDNNKYQRDRLQEYPKIAELVVALYDTQDRAEIDKRRADVKKKYPKN